MNWETGVYSFEDFELDPVRFELRRAGTPVAVEPQVFSLLVLMVGSSGRLVTKDEIVEEIWGGRIVSEAAISSRIKSLRQALGDDGKAQRLIRTVHGKGLRFVGEVTRSTLPAATAAATVELITPTIAKVSQFTPQDDAPATLRRPSIAVLPFALSGEAGSLAFLSEALSHELIAEFSRLRWLHVIARGSSFRFRSYEADLTAVRNALEVRYCLIGSIAPQPDRVQVMVELCDADGGHVVWTDSYEAGLDELAALRKEIARGVVRSAELRIPDNEAQLARHASETALDPWSRFHLGLEHMYRFTAADNARAAQLFEQALAQDSGFSRALGGLSFTRFQNAFLKYADDPAAQADNALALATEAVQADRLDPFAHFNLGRAMWLQGNLPSATACFDEAVSLSPNYALGCYNRGLVETLAGQTTSARQDLLRALQLSPLDPLRYAMVSSQALGQIQLGDFAAAQELTVKAALLPGAHKHIELIAAMAANLNSDKQTAAQWVAKASSAEHGVSTQDFLYAFPYQEGEAREQIVRALSDLGV